MLHDAWKSELENESDPDDATGVCAYKYDRVKRPIKNTHERDLSEQPKNLLTKKSELDAA